MAETLTFRADIFSFFVWGIKTNTERWTNSGKLETLHHGVSRAGRMLSSAPDSNRSVAPSQRRPNGVPMTSR